MVETPATAMFVHERGNRSLDGLFRLIEVAGQSRPLEEVLSSICEQVAAVAPADVVSIYVRDPSGRPPGWNGDGGNAEDRDGADVHGREGEPGFTLRANVGFPAHAIGRVRLRLGEGIVGFVAERMRPVSVETAERDEHFKYVPGLGEERFPAMLAVPVLRGASAAAVLVLQRTAGETFSGEEVVLATALAAVLSHALDRAEERERERERHAARTVARLRGVALAGEAAMGRAEILPTLSALAGSGPGAREPGGHEPAAREPARLAFQTVMRRLRSEMDAVRTRAGAAGAAAFAGEITSLMLLLEDRRFGEAVEAATAAPDPHRALSDLARDYAKAPFRTRVPEGDEADLMTSRASEIEDLCVLVHAAMAGRSIVRAGSIVVAERLRTFLAVSAIASGASAFVIENDLPKNGLVAEVVRSSGRPLLARVKGVFAWVRPGDLLVVDAKSGSVRVNPEATAVARFRKRGST